jgi:membrane protein DedA with SNARE-associated domain
MSWLRGSRRFLHALFGFARPGMMPLFFGLAFLTFAVLYQMLGLPSPAKIIATVRPLYLDYGPVIIIPAAFVEGAFMVSFYFPGSFVILLSVVLSDRSVISLVEIGLLSLIGFVLANVLNYWIGRVGLYRALLFLGHRDTVERMQEWMVGRELKAILMTSIHPNVVAITVVCGGIARCGLIRTVALSALGLTAWGTAWISLLAIVLPSTSLTGSNQYLYIVGFFLVWALVLMVRSRLASARGR